MLERKTIPPRGVLHVGRTEPDPGLERFEASPPLRPFVEHYWSVAWQNQPAVTRETVPHPSVHLSLESGRSELHGVWRRRFSRVIEGTGRVLGTKFRPGGFRPFMRESADRLTGKVVPPSAIFGPAIDALEAEATACPKACDAFEQIDAFLARLDPQPTAELERVTQIADVIAQDRSIIRVEMLVDRYGNCSDCSANTSASVRNGSSNASGSSKRPNASARETGRSTSPQWHSTWATPTSRTSSATSKT